MIDDSRVTKDDANGLEPAAPRILARQLARPLTDNEIDYVAGGMISRGRGKGVPRRHVGKDLLEGLHQLLPAGPRDPRRFYTQNGASLLLRTKKLISLVWSNRSPLQATLAIKSGAHMPKRFCRRGVGAYNSEHVPFD